MATITATINLSTDITNYSASSTMTMRKLGSTTGLDNSSGIATKKFQAITEVVVIEQDEVTDSKAIRVQTKKISSM